MPDEPLALRFDPRMVERLGVAERAELLERLRTVVSAISALPRAVPSLLRDGGDDRMQGQLVAWMTCARDPGT